MKKKFLVSLFYTTYLILLGQGCSVLKTEDSGLLLKIPTLKIPTSVSLPQLPTVTIARVAEVAPESDKLVIADEVFALENVSEKVVSKESIREQYTESAYRFENAKIENDLLVSNSASLKTSAVSETKPLRKIINIAKLEKFKEKDIGTVVLDSDIEKNRSKKVEPIVTEKYALDDKTGFEHNGFELSVSENLSSTQWMNTLSEGLTERMANIESESSIVKSRTASVLPLKREEDSSKMTVESFVNDEEDFSDIVKKSESSVVKNDDLMFLDYSSASAKEGEALVENQAPDVIQENRPVDDISSAVRSVIDREMSGVSKKSDTSRLLAMATSTSQSGQSISNISDFAKNLNNAKENSDKSEKNNYNNQATLYAIESDLEKGFQESVTNFDFIPSHDSNSSLRDFNEGSITVDYSLVNQTGLLRGTILKNFYMRTTFEIPLGSEYSKFEVPLIPKDSLGDYLDKHDLDGYGGFFLVDLGDRIEDVDVEKTSRDKVSAYEHRLLLNEEFKPVKNGADYRYVLFIGVIPGSINVRYLGVNGQETSKLTFITADEVSYDFSQIERPHLLSFRTRVRNTLGMSTTPLDLSVSSITSFLDEVNPMKTSESSYEIKVPWSVRGMRNYFKFKYLEDNIFVGIDRDQDIELPSKEFIEEILRSFNMDSLGAECVLQMNFSESVSEILIQAESERGPANFEHTYLDRDGVFTPEISPLSQKFFAIGYEEGIFSIKVSYEDGRSDYLRTYCSPSTYLIEQL